MTKEEKLKKIESVKWYHCINLGDGITTPGHKHKQIPNPTQSVLKRIHLPDDLTGKTVLDIGCSDGFFAFECEKRGAKKVVAIDWSKIYEPYKDRINTFPKTFQIAKEILNSNVELIDMDMFDINPEKLGKFDIVLGIAILYHLKSPYTALELIRQLTKEFTIIETHYIIDNEPIMKFLSPTFKEGHSVRYFSIPALEFMMKEIGFKVAIIDITKSGDTSGRVAVKGE